MTHTELKLWTSLPINRWHIEVNHSAFGWGLLVQHAHVHGLLTDCETVRYGPLAEGEVLDVIDGVLSTLSHP